MHFTTVGKEIFKGARQAQKLEAPGRDDPKVFARLRKIKLAKTLREAKKDWKEIQELVGTTRSTYYSWKRGYQVSEGTVGRMLLHCRATAGLAAKFLEAAHGLGGIGAHGVSGLKEGGSQSRMS